MKHPNTHMEQLEQLSKAWKAQFDNPPSLPLSWSVDAAGVLTLDGVGVCPASDLTAADAYDVEWLRLDLQTGYVVIEIDWPFEGPARISEIVTHKEVPAA